MQIKIFNKRALVILSIIALIMILCGVALGLFFKESDKPADAVTYDAGTLVYYYTSSGTTCGVYDCDTSYSGSISIPSSVYISGKYYTVNQIRSSAFSGCSKVRSISIPTTVTTISSSAFRNCTSLTSITIPSGVTSLSTSAFSGCTNLSTISVNSSNTTYAAYNGILYNKAYTQVIKCPPGKSGSVTLYSSATTINSSAFSGCTKITSVTIHSKITSIGSSAFSGSTALTTVSLPTSGLKTISSSAFSGCTKLSSLGTIPSTVTSIGSNAFYNCTSLTGISVNSSNRSYKSSGGILYNYAGTTLMVCPAGKSGSFSILSTTRTIDSNAFYNCSKITSGFSLQSSVTSIGSSAFYGCTSMTGTLSLPSGLTSLGSNAFYNCSKITGSINIPSKITTINGSTFYNCSGLSGTLTIPSTVTSIGSSAFRGCTSLKGTLSLPANLTSIGSSAFYNCRGFTGSATIPAGVTTINSSAFYGCSGITSFYLRNGLASISNLGSSAFTGGNSSTTYYFYRKNAYDVAVANPSRFTTSKFVYLGATATFDPAGGTMASENLFDSSKLQVDSSASGGNNQNLSYTFDAETATWHLVISDLFDPYVFTQLRADLTANTTYYFHATIANEDGVVGAYGNGIRIYYTTTGGIYTEPQSFQIPVSGSYSFVPSTTGNYEFRFDDDAGMNLKISDVYIYSSTTSNSFSQSVDGDSYYQLPIPTRENYTFLGWTSSDSSVTINKNVMHTGSNNNFTVTAQWRANQCTVTLDQAGGTGGTTSVLATPNQAMPSITVPTRTGYTFGGYFSGQNGSGTQYYNIDGSSAITCNLTADTTLYAKWTANQYAVTLHFEDGTGATSSVMATYDETMPSITVPTRTGYIFSGYYAEVIGGGTQFYDSNGASATSYNVASDLDIYAMWLPATQRVTLNLGGGTVTNGMSLTDIFTSSTVYKLEKGASVPTINVTNLSLEQGADYLISLVYVANGEILFNIDLFPDGLPEIRPTATTDAQLLNSVMTPAVADASSCRLRFFNDRVNPTTADTYITNVVFSKIDYVSDSSTLFVMYGGKYSNLPTPTRDNYDFLGWYLDSNYSKPVTADTLVTTTSDHTLYAKWELSNVILTVQTNYAGINGVTGGGVYKYGDNVTVTAERADSRFVFREWQINGQTVSKNASYQIELLADTAIVAVYDFKFKTFEINHISKLFWLADRISDGYDFDGVTFVLTGDLDLSYIKDKTWKVIGDATHDFSGIIKGNGYKITYNASTNATVNGGTALLGDNITLFGANISGVVENLFVDGNISLGVDDANPDKDDLPLVNDEEKDEWQDHFISKPR